MFEPDDNQLQRWRWWLAVGWILMTAAITWGFTWWWSK